MAATPANTVAAFAGEPLDALVWRVMGSVAGALEATLALNPHLVGTVILSEGDAVTLPSTAFSRAPQTLSTIKLWD